MCGHGTIGSITIGLEEGLIIPQTPGTVRVETPAGLVIVSYILGEQHPSGKRKVQSVKISNVPSFLFHSELAAHCPGLGELVFDVAYGGNFYAIVDVQKNFAGLENFSSGTLVEMARAFRKNINEHFTFVHPENDTIHGCSHVLWTGAVLDKKSTARNAVFYGEKAIDRSPCGTGTSARMAQWYAKGKLKPGDCFIHESIIGSAFTGIIEEELEVAGIPAIRPGIKGWAKVYGYNTITINPDDDPFAHGFQVV
jgi:4-hydroxyproline epimerase